MHEVDAMGGEIGKMADRCYLQKRVLNRSKVGTRDKSAVISPLCLDLAPALIVFNSISNQETLLLPVSTVSRPCPCLQSHVYRVTVVLLSLSLSRMSS